MKIIPRIFEFTGYKFEPKQKKITFNYRIEFSNKEPLNFSETILLPEIPSLKNIPQSLLENLLKSIHLILGISYYKLYCPPVIKLQNPLSKELRGWQ